MRILKMQQMTATGHPYSLEFVKGASAIEVFFFFCAYMDCFFFLHSLVIDRTFNSPQAQLSKICSGSSSSSLPISPIDENVWASEGFFDCNFTGWNRKELRVRRYPAEHKMHYLSQDTAAKLEAFLRKNMKGGIVYLTYAPASCQVVAYRIEPLLSDVVYPRPAPVIHKILQYIWTFSRRNIQHFGAQSPSSVQERRQLEWGEGGWRNHRRPYVSRTWSYLALHAHCHPLQRIFQSPRSVTCDDRNVL